MDRSLELQLFALLGMAFTAGAVMVLILQRAPAGVRYLEVLLLRRMYSEEMARIERRSDWIMVLAARQDMLSRHNPAHADLFREIKGLEEAATLLPYNLLTRRFHNRLSRTFEVMAMADEEEA